MSITTKAGDKGKTYLLCGEKKFKNDLRVEVCGTLDELCSFLGMSKSLDKDKKARIIIEDIQRDLFIIGAEIAAAPKHLNKLKKRIDKKYISKLEQFIEKWEKTEEIKSYCFCLPGANLTSSSFDVSRAVARRAERLMVSLKRKKILRNSDIIIYLNRLSDLLYLFARKHGKNAKA